MGRSTRSNRCRLRKPWKNKEVMIELTTLMTTLLISLSLRISKEKYGTSVCSGCIKNPRRVERARVQVKINLSAHLTHLQIRGDVPWLNLSTWKSSFRKPICHLHSYISMGWIGLKIFRIIFMRRFRIRQAFFANRAGLDVFVRSRRTSTSQIALLTGHLTPPIFFGITSGKLKCYISWQMWLYME